MGQRITVVDAFTDRPFTGNPAAVCILNTPREEDWMQAVAREMNLSETAFLDPRPDGWGLRWFTPEIEVELCGHATLASAHVLWEEGRAPAAGTLRFHTRSGILTAARSGDGIDLDFPAIPARQTAPPPELLRALNAEPRWAGETRFDWLVELESEDGVRSLSPDMRTLTAARGRGFMVTARAEAGNRHRGVPYDFVSRFFAPGAGIPEDPVTGSAHCSLGPYWSERLGRSDLTGYQCSARGGLVRVRLAGNRVILGGRAVTVLRAELEEPGR